MVNSVAQRVRRAAGRIVRGQRKSDESHDNRGERNAEWYDARYAARDKYAKHYTESVYYASWSVIIDRLKSASVQSVLDIGCGPGQFASVLRDTIGCEYLGLDFCEEAILMARRVCPEYNFCIADAFKDRSLEDADYDAVISLEFLEHVERDLEVLRRIRDGVLFIGSVPNFPSDAHVRWFEDEDSVSARYAELFDEFRVDKQLLSNNGKCLYLMQGVRKA